MASTKCWHCHELAQMVDPIGQPHLASYFPGNGHFITFPDTRFMRRDEPDLPGRLYLYSCVNCGYPNIAEVEELSKDDWCDRSLEERIVRWLPIEPLGKDYPNVPDTIASLANEVHKCLEIGANRAAVIMARGALEGIVTDQEKAPSKKNLYERIENLRKEGIITSRTADSATAIRLCGNDYVHNVLEPVDREYTEIVIQILDSMIDDLYSNPSLVAKAKAYAEGRGEARKENSHGTN